MCLIFLSTKIVKRSIRNSCFPGFASSLLKHKKVLNLAKKFNFLKYKKQYKGFFFIFWFGKVASWNITESSVSWNIRKLFRAVFLKKTFCGLRLEIAIGSYFCKIVHHRGEYASSSKYTRVLNMLLVLNMLGFWIYQGSEYASKSKYAKVLNMLLVLYLEPGSWIFKKI